MSLKQLNKFEYAQPEIKISRSKFDMSFSHKTTIKAGDLVPIYLEEVLPGDTFVIDTNTLTRMNLPAVPIMDDLYQDIFFFWVPNRICCNGEKDWQRIIANENVNGPFAPVSEATLQNTNNTIALSDFINSDDSACFAGDSAMYDSLFNYLVNPVGYNGNSMDSDADVQLGGEISRLPFVAYGLIWNNWFRDENTQSPIAAKDLTWIQTATEPNSCLKVNRFRDYFSSCLPAPQKGASVNLPLGSLAPVVVGDDHYSAATATNHLRFAYSGTATDDYMTLVQAKGSGNNRGDVLVNPSDTTGEISPLYTNPINLWTDLSSATAATVSELRMAFAIQKMLETDSRCGSRYKEFLLAFYGVSIPDNTIQIPEYLGGKRFHLDVNQVVQVAPGASSPIGNLGGISTTFNHSKSVVKSFNEHGYIIGVTCIRPQHSYSQGIPKLWTRNRRFDWYNPKFANLSEMAVFKRELFLDNNSVDPLYPNGYDVFGYQEAWAEYRFHPNKTSGALAPQNGLADLGIWTYSDYYQSYPSLNSFNQESKDLVGRSLVDTKTKFQFLCDFFFDVKAIRPLPVFSIPGLIDHH